jgi:small subunit ribosomal protein S4
MARYRDAICRLCRRENQKLFLKGQRCYTNKCAQERRPYPPGQQGESGGSRRRPSDYGIQLREKQKLRNIYGLLEKPFRRYVDTAERAMGVTGEVLLQLLERRLDNVFYRSGLASSRAEARQLVSHQHLTVNGRRVNVPSFQVRAGDVIKVQDKSKTAGPFKELRSVGGVPVPEWLSVDAANLTITINNLPTRDQIEVGVDEQQVVEFYSR